MSGLTALVNNRYKLEEIPDLTGKTALVTGGSAGIGYHISLALALRNAKVILVAAKDEHGEKVAQSINQILQANDVQGSLRWKAVDFGSLKEVDTLAKEILHEEPRLDLLINNAGLGVSPWGLTKDSIGNHFQVNNLAHFVLTNRLFPLLAQTAEDKSTPPGTVRIVNQSSELHRAAPSDTAFKSKQELAEERDPNILYARSKLGIILLTNELNKRKLSYNPHNILSCVVLSLNPQPESKMTQSTTAISTHPGVVSTDQQKGFTEHGVLGKLLEPLVRAVAKTPAQGVETALWAATDHAIAVEPEKYQCKYFTEPRGKPDNESSQAKDPALASQFWELCDRLSEELLGEKVA